MIDYLRHDLCYLEKAFHDDTGKLLDLYTSFVFPQKVEEGAEDYCWRAVFKNSENRGVEVTEHYLPFLSLTEMLEACNQQLQEQLLHKSSDFHLINRPNYKINAADLVHNGNEVLSKFEWNLIYLLIKHIIENLR